MILTGAIRLAGVLLGFASRELAVEAAWRDEGVYREYDNGRRELVTPRWRLFGRFGFRAVGGVQAAQLKALTDEPFELVLRTRSASDPETWPEMVVLARRTNPIEEARPLGSVRDGEYAYEIAVEFESVAVLERIPGAIEGGFSLEGTGSVGSYTTFDIEPWGDATLEPRTETRIVDGVERQITFYDPGPSELLPLVMERDPNNPLAWWLDTTSVLRLGSTKRDD